MTNQRKEDNDDEGTPNEKRDTEGSSTDDQNDKDEKDRGEGPGNLKRRSDWFQKRHGGG